MEDFAKRRWASKKNVREKNYPGTHLFFVAHLRAVQIIEQHTLIGQRHFESAAAH